MSEVCRRALAEPFLHMSCNPSNAEKLKTSLDAANQEKDELKRKLDAAEKDKSNLGEYETRADRGLPRLRR
ncbi:hypothetical protein DCAR_0414507 [Daucus carota subsp. sativus]|uniref:Uncharacterized protein n=1 Tax=Daucus carota subsp. sativus TaxID=79200 RepID=A0A175YAM8_DAUCS|nr:hypothetical protein DCAR_0414507 [Daucus carota subsp. sativus]